MNQSTNSTFLTDVPTRADKQRRVSAPTVADEAPPGPLVPFRVPPMPKAPVPRQYVPVDYIAPQSISHILPAWEKQMIIARLQKSPPVDTQRFQQRLCLTRKRNERAHLRSVCDRAAVAEQERILEREACLIRHEERREMILFKHQHRMEIKREEQFMARAKKWCTIVACHVFLTALMRERRMQEALVTFNTLMAPMAKRFFALRRRRKEAAELTQQHLRGIPFPFPHVINSMYGTFFKDWPSTLLERLVENSTPRYLRQGSYLMHAGDVGRVMFMITVGTVSIVLPKKGKDKRRTKENSTGVFQINAPCYVGEFALVCKEPRSASIYCETDIGYWAVLPEDYEEVAKLLSSAVASKQREATDVRRRQNLKRFFPLHINYLRQFSYFEMFSDDSLNRLIDSVEPIVLHDGDYLFREGEIDSSAYFVQDGVAVTRDRHGNDVAIPKGSCVGMFECSCGVNEAKRTSVVSINYCDVWRLKREVLIEVGMGEPAAFLHCRTATKKDRASEMLKDKSVLWCLKKDPYMAFCCPPSVLSRLFESSTPTVFLNGERLALMGQKQSSLVIVVNGVVDATVVRNREQVTSRVRLSAKPLSEAELQHASAPFRGLSRVIGAYEFASCLSQSVCTVTSFGLTEALVVDAAQLEAAVSSQLRNLMLRDTRAKDAIHRAYKNQDAGLLYGDSAISFAHHFKEMRDD